MPNKEKRAAAIAHRLRKAEAELSKLRKSVAELSVCQGGDELHEDHVRYCIPLIQRVQDLSSLDG